ncbi:N-acetylmuramoyl-L-alanine amidase [Streptomyces sp. M2CJ-2]|uniref:peptidoglycan recognition protein family protein n=1 Tax=Streptomyces sp. M2CJ-2 TaxID=2803948 RepID=UPI0019227783|nr:N-acetylmuramoyl-L-alanine amidase [Streptomyces sp. M2CJ-2]MBL3664551.1 N-acetylmuramoyl-L-alanine amidase [Streptomyces sp. M2CJ-2]
MATPLTHDQWLKILRAEGVRVEEYPGWRTRGRDAATGLAFGPVRMFLNHHTAGRNSRDLVAKNGIPGLPAPLAHIYLAKSGVATMCSAGRANHAGPMAVNAYQSFRDEKTVHPAPSRASGTIDGNDVAYGIETENLGDNKDVYPRAQYDAWVRINAAVCRHHGWTAESVGCHKETSVEGKVDPRGPVEGYGSRGRFEFTPQQFRKDVDERLEHEPGWNPGEEEDPMAGMTKRDIFDAVWKTDALAAPKDAADIKTNPTWQPQSILRDVQARVRSLTVTVAAQSAAINALAAKVGANVDTKTVVTAVEKAIADAVIKVDIDVTGPDAS